MTGAIDAGASGAYHSTMQARLQTVVETPGYLSAAKGVLSQTEQDEIVTAVAENPKAGTPATAKRIVEDYGRRRK